MTTDSLPTRNIADLQGFYTNVTIARPGMIAWFDGANVAPAAIADDVETARKAALGVTNAYAWEGRAYRLVLSDETLAACRADWRIRREDGRFSVVWRGEVVDTFETREAAQALVTAGQCTVEARKGKLFDADLPFIAKQIRRNLA